MAETIIMAIMAAAPAITAIAGIIAAVIKLVRHGKITNAQVIEEFHTLEKKVLDTKEYEALKDELLLAHQENRELKKKINELLTKIDHISRGEEDGKTTNE